MSKFISREILFFGDEFWKFYEKLSQKTKDKVNKTIGLVKHLELIPEKYFKHIIGTELYEIRVQSEGNYFRIFSFFDVGRLVIILNGFQKKTQKTPEKEIKRALKLMKEYYEIKQ